jgi:hypothetical protein
MFEEDPTPPAEATGATAAIPAEPQERVLLGLLASVAAVIAGAVLTVVIWRAGYIASITSFAIAAGAV